MGEIVAIVFRLEADQIVIGEAAEDFPVVRQGLQNVRRRAGRVEEKADRVAMAARAQLASQQHQMIVVHPDDVVLVEQRAQSIGEHAVDAHVAAGVGARVFLQVDPVVKDRPQHAVGEAVVIFLDVVFRQIDQDVGDLVDLDDVRLAVRLLRRPCRSSRTTFRCDFSARPSPPPPFRRRAACAGVSGTATRLETMMSRAPMLPPNSTTAASRC